MNEQKNIQVVKSAYDAFSNGDIAGVLNAVTEDVEWILPGVTEMHYAGEWHGKAGVGEFFRLLAETEEVEAFQPREFLAAGDTVVVLGSYRARVRATGAISDIDWVHVFNLRDGLVKKWREYYDTLAAAGAYRSVAAARN
jgi:hypothetical protein